MHMPGLDAEASRYTTNRSYRTVACAETHRGPRPK